MMAAVKRAIRRFGGAALADQLPPDDERVIHGPIVREGLNARLRAIEVDLDVQARRRLHYDRGN